MFTYNYVEEERSNMKKTPIALACTVVMIGVSPALMAASNDPFSNPYGDILSSANNKLGTGTTAARKLTDAEVLALKKRVYYRNQRLNAARTSTLRSRTAQGYSSVRSGVSNVGNRVGSGLRSTGNFAKRNTYGRLKSYRDTLYGKPGLYVSFMVGSATPRDLDLSELDSTIASGLTDTANSTDLKSGVATGLAVGYRFGTYGRIEGELGYQTNDLDGADGDMQNTSFMINYYYDMPLRFPVKPFFTLGAGVSQVDYESGSFSDDDMVFAWQFGLGATYQLTKKINFDLKYRFFKTSTPTFGDDDTSEFNVKNSSNNVYLGFRYTF
jgi:outer membrane immunogenic protein